MIKNNLFTLIIILVCVLATGCASPDPEAANADNAQQPAVPQLGEVWSLESGLDRPESVIYDPARDVLYVTNIVGDGAEMDGNGYIALVSAEGTLLEEKWIEGLNAPKGIALDGDKLWASDINALVEINLVSGSNARRYSLDGDAYLNDVAVHPDGSVFVTDSRYSKIYRLSQDTLSLWLASPSIQMPNGAHVIGEELVVVAGDDTSENPGANRYFQAINLSDQGIRTLADSAPDGALDAVEPDGKGGIFTSDWAGGRLMYFKEGQGATLLRQLGQGSADVDFIAETGMLYVPVMQEGKLIAYQVD